MLQLKRESVIHHILWKCSSILPAFPHPFSLSVPFFLSISFYLSLFPISPSLSISIYTLSSPLSSDSISSLLFTSFSLPTSLPHSLIDALPLHILAFPSSNSLLNFHSVGSEPICLHLKPLFNHVGVFVP